MENIRLSINQILSDWDPLNVGRGIASDEYNKYIIDILKYINSQEQLTIYLEKMLVKDLDTGYDKDNHEHKGAVALIVKKLNNLVLEQ